MGQQQRWLSAVSSGFPPLLSLAFLPDVHVSEDDHFLFRSGKNLVDLVTVHIPHLLYERRMARDNLVLSVVPLFPPANLSGRQNEDKITKIS